MTRREASPGVRLQKVLARAGVASRRAAEQLIRAGRVRVDGRVARELGVRVDPRDARVEVDGRRIVAEPLVYIVLNKPRGVVCTLSDPEDRPTVAELLRGAGARVLPVGRLDFNTGGALLCTNDGEFANGVAHPRHHAPKEYLVKVGGVVDERALDAFRESISIEGRATKPADVKLVRVEGDKSWLAVRLEEGRNRQVRRLAEHAGLVVMRLVRTSHAGITVEGVRTGHFRHLTVDELTALRDEYGVPKRIPRGATPEPPSTPRASFRGKNRGERHSGNAEPRPAGRPPFRGKERPERRFESAEPGRNRALVPRQGTRRRTRDRTRQANAGNERGGERGTQRGRTRHERGNERGDERGSERRRTRHERGKERGRRTRQGTRQSERGKERGGERGKERGSERGKERGGERGGRRSGRSGEPRSSASGGRGFAGRRGT